MDAIPAGGDGDHPGFPERSQVLLGQERKKGPPPWSVQELLNDVRATRQYGGPGLAGEGARRGGGSGAGGRSRSEGGPS